MLASMASAGTEAIAPIVVPSMPRPSRISEMSGDMAATVMPKTAMQEIAAARLWRRSDLERAATFKPVMRT